MTQQQTMKTLQLSSHYIICGSLQCLAAAIVAVFILLTVNDQKHCFCLPFDDSDDDEMLCDWHWQVNVFTA